MDASPYNLCSLPPWLIASKEYNLHPQPLDIQGVRSANRFLFERLEQCADPQQRALIFHDYMDVRFQLHQWQQETSPNSRKSLKNSYLRFLKGWMFDANSVEGAVLKGWVESRLGLPPLFHRRPLADPHDDAWRDYQIDRMRGAQRTSAILSQLDLLYEFVQEELRRRHPDLSHLVLYRGVHDFSEHHLVEKYDRRHYLLRLNNLNSFTDDFERAWEFGSRVIKTAVPLPKIFFRGDLFPSALLKGENEALVVGGLYQVEVLTGG